MTRQSEKGMVTKIRNIAMAVRRNAVILEPSESAAKKEYILDI